MGELARSPSWLGQNLAGTVPLGENMKISRFLRPPAGVAANAGRFDKNGMAAEEMPSWRKKSRRDFIGVYLRWCLQSLSFLCWNGFFDHGYDGITNMKIGIEEDLVELSHLAKTVGIGGLLDEMVEEVF